MKITAGFAGLGAAVGAVLFLVLRFVVGRSVLAALPSSVSDGLPRRYADYLPTVVGSSPVATVRVLLVLVATGLVAGLLAGVVLRVAASRRTARPGGPWATIGLAAFGLLVGVALAVELHAYGRHGLPNNVGWWAYSPLGHDGVLYGGGPTPSWWPLVLTGAVVGLLVGAVAAGLTFLLVRRGSFPARNRAGS